MREKKVGKGKMATLDFKVAISFCREQEKLSIDLRIAVLLSAKRII